MTALVESRSPTGVAAEIAAATVSTVGLTKVHRAGDVDVHALRGVDLTIRKGEFAAIVGPSGPGKSTLLNLIGCLDRPTGGAVFIGGEDVAKLPDATVTDVRCRRIGYAFQRFSLLPFLSALQNVALQARLAGVRDRQARALEALDQVGLADRARHLPRQLSGGEQQRGAVARALVKSPSFILADEPTGNLDSVAGALIARIFGVLNERGVTILMVTHNTELANLAGRTIFIRDGVVGSSNDAPRTPLRRCRSLRASPRPPTGSASAPGRPAHPYRLPTDHALRSGRRFHRG